MALCRKAKPSFRFAAVPILFPLPAAPPTVQCPPPSGIRTTLLCLSSGIRGAVGVERAVYAAGQIALNASADFPVGAAFCPPLLDVFPGFRIVGHFGKCDHVEGPVQASVSPSVQSVPDGVS